VFVRVNTQGGGGKARLFASDPPTKTTFSTEPVLTAEYIAGLLALREVLGFLSLPARRFLFKSSSKLSRNFFSVADVQGGMQAGMLHRPGLVK
jgi:hypothetical protein